MAEYPGVRLGQRGGLYDLYQYYLGGGDQVTDAPVSTVNTTQFIQPVSGGQGDGQVFSNVDGNAFGYGNAIQPGDSSVLTTGPYAGQSGYYDSINYSGGLPGNVSQKGPGRYFQYDDTGDFYKDYSLTPKKELPGFMKAAAAFIPFGTAGINFLESKMNPEGPFTKDDDLLGGTYKIGGMDNAQKKLYNSLSSQGMLFDGPGGVKTLTGKNFAGKGYLEGQLELADKFGFTNMTDDEIEEAIAKQAFENQRKFKTKSKGFTYLQMVEAANVLKNQNLTKDSGKDDGITSTLTTDDDEIVNIEAVKAAIEAKKKQDQKKFLQILNAKNNAGITQTITTPPNVEMSEGAEGGGYDAGAVSSSSQGVSSAGNTAPSTSRGPAGGATTGGGGGGAAAGMGGGSQQAKSSGSTNSGRTDGGWGWKDGGLVQRKPYGDGGIVDLL